MLIKAIIFYKNKHECLNGQTPVLWPLLVLYSQIRLTKQIKIISENSVMMAITTGYHKTGLSLRWKTHNKLQSPATTDGHSENLVLKRDWMDMKCAVYTIGLSMLRLI